MPQGITEEMVDEITLEKEEIREKIEELREKIEYEETEKNTIEIIE
jgi:uncharacterized protein YdhG (YjbR/CyaY superfamily)